jgi:hypothetical protein
MKTAALILIILFQLKSSTSAAYLLGKQNDSSLDKLKHLPGSNINNQISSLNEHLTKRSVRYLQKLQKKDQRQKNQILKIDSAAGALFENANEKYDHFYLEIIDERKQLSTDLSVPFKYLDTLHNSLSFLNQFKGIQAKVTIPPANLLELQNKLFQTERINQYIHNSKQQIKSLCLKFTCFDFLNLP